MVNLIRSVVEGIESLGEGIGHLVKGEFDEFGKDMARFGMEAAGMVGHMFAGPMAEQLQEMIEGAVDGRLEGPGTGDVPSPDSDATTRADVAEVDGLWGRSAPVQGGIPDLVDALSGYGGPDDCAALEALLDVSDISDSASRETASKLAKVGAAFDEIGSMERASKGVYTRQMTSI